MRKRKKKPYSMSGLASMGTCKGLEKRHDRMLTHHNTPRKPAIWIQEVRRLEAFRYVCCSLCVCMRHWIYERIEHFNSVFLDETEILCTVQKGAVKSICTGLMSICVFLCKV